MQDKVLFVATVYRHLAAFHIPLFKLLQNWGYEVQAAASPEGRGKEEVEAVGVQCWDIPFSRSPASLQNFSAYWKLKTLLKRNHYALIHVHTPVAAWIGRLAAKCTRQGPVLYTAHGFHFYKGAPWHYWAFYYPLERLAACWTDGLIVINREDYERAKKMGFKEGKNLFYVHGVGVDLEKFSTFPLDHKLIRKEMGLGADDVIVTCIAEFTPTKNHAFLFGAWKVLGKEEPRARLVLVGDGPLRRIMEDKVKKEKIPHVHFLGFRSDVPLLLQITDILVLTSKREGLPRSIMEAMAAGKPVVATNVRGSRDLVENEVTGLLVKLGDVKGLAEALLRLIRNAEVRERMGKAGQERIKVYSLERVSQEMAEIYARYLSRRGSGI